MSNVSSSPPRAPPIKYPAPLGTRWAKETAAAGGVGAFDLPTDPKTLGPWILGECVGKGASGRVKIAKHRFTGQLAAVKILPIAPIVSSRTSLATQQAKSAKQRLGIDREITMMKLMNHPNIMRIYDVYEGGKELFLVLEYVEGGELFDFLVNRGRLPPTEALAFFKQIIYGLNYAHSFSIIHRDLKPENILIASISPPLIKIADWGMAAFAHPSLSLETSCGSPHYASPEIVNGQTYKGNATDIWSCGVILYALLTGRLPFDDKNVKVLLSKVKSGKYDMPAWMDPLAKDLLCKMLVVDTEKRIKMSEIMSHPWFHSLEIPASIEQHAAELAMAELPPSPSILARPIASPSLIDPELFTSLRIIWGRHTDPKGDSIRRDLCSPAGQGVHAKAFYFLLSQYRENSSRNGLEENEENLMKAKFNLGWELSSVNKVYDGKRNSTYSVETLTPHTASAPIISPGPLIRRYSGSIRDSFSRQRAPSPAGPRAPHMRTSAELWRSRPLFSPDDYIMKSPLNSPDSAGVGRGGSRPAWPRHRLTDPQSRVGGKTSTVQFPQQLQAQDILDQYRPKPSAFVTSPDSSINNIVPSMDASTTPPLSNSQLYPSAPIPTPEPVSVMEVLEDIKAGLPRGAVPALGENQKGVFQPLSAAPLGTLSLCNPQASPAALNSATMFGAAAPPSGSKDKENQPVDDAWNIVKPEEYSVRGLGLGVGRERGKIMENVTNAPEPTLTAKSKKKKEKKSRPPALDIRGLNQQKRITILGSPITASPHFTHAPTGRLMTSPVIEEFKGWFSSLFSWSSKSHGNGLDGVLYSLDGVSETRAGIRRLLQGMGVVTENYAYEGSTEPALVDRVGFFKCRVEEFNVARSSLNLKPVRFRIEFFAAPGPLPSPQANKPERPDVPPLNQDTITRDRNAAAIPNGRTNTRINKSPSADGRFPAGCTCAIYMAYEKGSVSSFRLIWRRLEEDYQSDASGTPCYHSCSPAMVSTPMAEYAEAISVDA